MFDLAWSEIALIAVVAVVVIGPKDLPDAVRGVARSIQKLRRMAGEFQGHLDEVVREAKLEDVRDQIRDIRNFDLKSTIEKAVDEDGSITKTFRDDPFRAPPPPTSDAAPASGTDAALPDAPPPADATAQPDGVVAAEAAADKPDATPVPDYAAGAGPGTDSPSMPSVHASRGTEAEEAVSASHAEPALPPASGPEPDLRVPPPLRSDSPPPGPRPA